MRVYPKTRIGCNQFAALQGPAAAWQKFVPRCDDGVVSLWASINAFHTASWLFESADISSANGDAIDCPPPMEAPQGPAVPAVPPPEGGTNGLLTCIEWEISYDGGVTWEDWITECHLL